MTAPTPQRLHSPSSPPTAGISRVSTAVFATTVFLSAFLLFQIQPLISRIILPWFGGSPGVWTTCMLFFQLLLFLGYLYSHLLTSRLSISRQTIVHSLLLLGTLALLQIFPDAQWKPANGDSPTLRILGLLSVTAGLPYFVLSTNGPLLLRWFSLLRPDASPHRLYALSNSGSLLALLSYPLLFEPALSLPGQATLWTSGFVVFALCCAISMLYVRGASRTQPLADVQNTDSGSVAPDLSTLLLWFGLACLASVMLIAETNQICQDVAVVPFLWILPLALYLVSFILCFESERWYVRRWFGPVTAALLLALCWVQTFGLHMHLVLQLLVWFVTLFAVFMLCHGELARLRPQARFLTLFYLTISAGGACGGLITALIAPAVFPGFWEHHAGILLSALVALFVWFHDRTWILSLRRPPLLALINSILLLVAIITVFAASVGEYTRSIAMVRNFYGVLEVEDFAPEDAMLLKHGRIVHGLQFHQMPSVPTMYYGYKTGVGRAIAVLRERKAANNGQLRAGLVGLGIGTLAAYGKPEDFMEFYEINSNVIKLAEQHFTFLSNCKSRVEIIKGDARLSLENQPPQQFDLLVLDAFSGDAIPTHLLTVEAFQSFRRHMAPNGIIAVHISNIHLNLQRVTDGISAVTGLAMTTITTLPESDEDSGLPLISNPGSRWVLMAEAPSTLKHSLLEQNAVPSSPQNAVFWTDHFTNLIQILNN